MDTPEEELEEISKALDIARQYGLEAEVVKSALIHMSENHNASIVDSIWYGYNEWIK